MFKIFFIEELQELSELFLSLHKMENLPNELTQHVLSFLHIADLLNFGATCSSYHQMLDDIRKGAKVLEKVDEFSVKRWSMDVFGRMQGQRYSKNEEREESTTYIDGVEKGESWVKRGNTFSRGHISNGKRVGKWFGYDGELGMCTLYDHQGNFSMAEHRDEKGTLKIHVYAGDEWVFGEGDEPDHFETIEYLFERDGEWFLTCKGKKYPVFRMYNIGDNYARTEDNEREYSHCCPKHQRQMPDSLF